MMCIINAGLIAYLTANICATKEAAARTTRSMDWLLTSFIATRVQKTEKAHELYAHGSLMIKHG